MMRVSAILFLCLLLPVGNTVYAETSDWRLKIEPKKCVSLRQGQVCYQDLKISWVAPRADNYCIHIYGENHSVKCWSQSSRGQIKLEFQGKSSQKFVLRKQHQNKDYASSTLEVKWVYKNQRNLRTGWRMF